MYRLYNQFSRYSAYLRLFFQTFSQRKNNHSLISKTIKMSPLLLSLSPMIMKCDNGKQQQIQEITKQQLVFLLHQTPPQELVVIVYDRFKKLNQNQFKEQLQSIINQCRTAEVKKIYMIDSKQAQYLQKIVRTLKNMPESSQNSGPKQTKTKSKSFQCYFKSKHFNEAFELQNTKQYKISEQISQIRHFQVIPNNDKLIQEVNHHINNRFTFNKSVIIKQCPGQGQCVQSYKNQIKNLIDGGMLTGKKDQFKFYLVVDHHQGILGASSQYFKNYQKFVQKISGGTLNVINRKQETYIFRRDLFGTQLGFWSDWMQKTGLVFDPSDRFMMFLHPRIHYITQKNTLTDLLWFLRVAKLSNEVSISLNNTSQWASTNGAESINTLKLLHSYYPKLNYLIVNTDRVDQLIRHMKTDYKYVIFKQDNNIIWKKKFLDLDSLQKTKDQEQKTVLFKKSLKHQIEDFIAQPRLKNLVEVDRQMEISLEKLKNLKEKQLKTPSDKNYIIRICQRRCGRNIKQEILEATKAKLQAETNVYWIDSTAQNIGLNPGNYILKQGQLLNLSDFLTAPSN